MTLPWEFSELQRFFPSSSDLLSSLNFVSWRHRDIFKFDCLGDQNKHYGVTGTDRVRHTRVQGWSA